MMLSEERDKHKKGRQTVSKQSQLLLITQPGITVRFILMVTIAIFAILTILISVAALLGGGFGAKQIRFSDALHENTSLVIAHRGVRQENPGNSREAFIAAREQGFKAVEIDVKRSADGHFYLFHDRISTRLLGVDIDLSKQNLVDLQRYPLHHNGQPTTQNILSLDTFLNEFGDDFIIYFDIKRHGERDVQQLTSDIAAFIKRHNLEQKAIVGVTLCSRPGLSIASPSSTPAWVGPAIFGPEPINGFRLASGRIL